MKKRQARKIVNNLILNHRIRYRKAAKVKAILKAGVPEFYMAVIQHFKDNSR